MLSTLIPLTLIKRPIPIIQPAPSLLLILHIPALIDLAIRPGKLPEPMHLVIQPLTLILAAVAELHYSFALALVVAEVAGVGVAIRPEELALPVFLVLMVEPLEPCAICKGLFALALSHIKFPLTLVLAPIHRVVSTNPMGLIILPLSDIHITIGMQQPALPSGHPVLEISAIHTTIGKVQLA